MFYLRVLLCTFGNKVNFFLGIAGLQMSSTTLNVLRTKFERKGYRVAVVVL
jgi:hypothetical protein